MALIKFTRNHNDLSADRGFQFEFYCDRCGGGYQSTFRGSAAVHFSLGADDKPSATTHRNVGS